MKKIFVCLSLVGFLGAAETQWGNFPPNITLNSGDNINIKANGTLEARGYNLYNTGSFTYTTNGSSASTLTLTPATSLTSFYNRGSINIKENSNLILNLQTTFNLDTQGSYNIAQNASLVATGNEFTSTGGKLINRGETTLNFQTFNIKASGDKAIFNDGGKITINTDYLFNGRTAEGNGAYGIFETTNSGKATINLNSGYLSNFGYVYDIYSFKGSADGKNLSAISILKSTAKAELNIKGGDVKNGGDVEEKFGSSSVRYKSGAGYIIADDAKITIDKNLISEGAGSHLLDAADIVRSKIQAINNANINIGGNFSNKNYSDVYLTNNGQINVAGNFTSNAHTNLYFGGNSAGYGLISAKNIDITGANVFFYKGNAAENTPYTFLKASNLLKYDFSLLDKKEVLSQDGSISVFYTLSLKNIGNALQVSFERIPGSKPSNNEDMDQNEKTIADSFEQINPIANFDITNLSPSQAKNLTQNIQSGIQAFVHNKNKLTQLRFDASRAQIFNRMIKSHSSSLSSYHSLPKYAFNTISTTPRYRTDARVLDGAFGEDSLSNSLYVDIVGGYQKSTSGYGYAYGLNIGYDKTFGENLFLGAYAGYDRSGLDVDVLKIQSDNLQMGIYSQANLSIFQTEAVAIYNYSNAKATKDISILSSDFFSTSRYSTHSFDGLLQGGVPFKFGHNNIIKPYIGINANINMNAPISEEGNALNSQYLFDNQVRISGILGVTYVKYFENMGYFFIRPFLEYTFYDSQKSTSVIFLGNVLSIAAAPKEHFGNVLLGGQVPIRGNLFVNLNLSMGASTSKTFMSIGSASLKFLF